MRSLKHLTLLAVLAVAGLTRPVLAQNSSLESLLRAFAERRDEKAMQTLRGIVWRGVSYPNDSEKDNATTYVLRGGLILEGFARPDSPLGAGSERSTRIVTEGDAKFEVRFSTSNNPALRGPYEIVLTKSRMSLDYTALLQRQLSQGQLVLMADRCTHDALARPAEEERAAYYRIDFPGAPSPVFVRMSVLDGGKTGPGQTSFVFSLFTPGKDMANSGCTLHKSNP